MFNIQKSLFNGERIVLGPIDPEKDAEVEARWTNDASYLRMLSMDPAMPRSVSEIKKTYDEIEKSQIKNRDLFYFSIRLREDDRLIGFGMINWIMWVNAIGWIRLGIGDAKDRGHGLGSEALALLQNFAFSELNLHRLSALIPEYNVAGLGLFRKFGFIDEICQRQAIERDGRRWNLLVLGQLSSEWSKMKDTL